jgi:hypothetical protein
MPKAARERVAKPHETPTVQGLNFKTTLNPTTKDQWLSGVLQNESGAAESGFRPIGQIVNEVPPKISAARERDRLARLRLGLPPVNWG